MSHIYNNNIFGIITELLHDNDPFFCVEIQNKKNNYLFSNSKETKVSQGKRVNSIVYVGTKIE